MIRRLMFGAALAGAVLGSQAVEAMPLGTSLGNVANAGQANVEKVVIIVRRGVRRPARMIRRRPAVIIR